MRAKFARCIAASARAMAASLVRDLALTLPNLWLHTACMSEITQSRKPSVSAPPLLNRGPESARDRILRALELGRRGQVLAKLGEHARSSGIARPR